ncbi:hypothetical protein VN12_06445 [Pirellula sp. SH-Sr6A]|nr:hypothetical protein VN12_06445 [Pirellula sp. SH-Sr6A]
MNDGNRHWQDWAIELIKLASSVLIVIGAWMKNKERWYGPQQTSQTKPARSKPKERNKTRARAR